jgi:hypothetical protein
VKRFGRAVVLLLLSFGAALAQDPASDSITVEDLRRHMTWLADDAREGREAGSAGGAAAAEYIRKHFESCGLEPGGEGGGSFFRWFSEQGVPGDPPADGSAGVGMRNVVAIKTGADAALKAQHILIGAHFDHVGRGAPPAGGGRGPIHNGSDDNASGTSAILELAEALPMLTLRRTVVLVAFDGEEKGLWGSKAYVERPALPMERCRWMINMDMISRNELKQIAVGRTDVTDGPLNRALGAAQKRFEFKFDTAGANELMRRSDQWNFHEKGVPAIFLFGGMHPDYHKETDDVDKANFEKVRLVARVVLCMIQQLDQEGP